MRQRRLLQLLLLLLLLLLQHLLLLLLLLSELTATLLFLSAKKSVALGGGLLGGRGGREAAAAGRGRAVSKGVGVKIGERITLVALDPVAGAAIATAKGIVAIAVTRGRGRVSTRMKRVVRIKWRIRRHIGSAKNNGESR